MKTELKKVKLFESYRATRKTDGQADSIYFHKDAKKHLLMMKFNSEQIALLQLIINLFNTTCRGKICIFRARDKGYS